MFKRRCSSKMHRVLSAFWSVSIKLLLAHWYGANLKNIPVHFKASSSHIYFVDNYKTANSKSTHSLSAVSGSVWLLNPKWNDRQASGPNPIPVLFYLAALQQASCGQVLLGGCLSSISLMLLTQKLKLRRRLVISCSLDFRWGERVDHFSIPQYIILYLSSVSLTVAGLSQ